MLNQIVCILISVIGLGCTIRLAKSDKDYNYFLFVAMQIILLMIYIILVDSCNMFPKYHLPEILPIVSPVLVILIWFVSEKVCEKWLKKIEDIEKQIGFFISSLLTCVLLIIFVGDGSKRPIIECSTLIGIVIGTFVPISDFYGKNKMENPIKKSKERVSKLFKETDKKKIRLLFVVYIVVFYFMYNVDKVHVARNIFCCYFVYFLYLFYKYKNKKV